jgi:hypothetical protein
MSRLLSLVAILCVVTGCSGGAPSRSGGALAEGAIGGTRFVIDGIRMQGEIDGRPLDEDGEGRGLLQSSSIVLTTLEASNAYGPIEQQTFPETVVMVDFPGDLATPAWAPGSEQRWRTPQTIAETGEILPPPPGSVYGTLCLDGNRECLAQLEATTRVVALSETRRAIVHDAVYGHLARTRAHVVTTWELVAVPAVEGSGRPGI